MGPKRAMKIIHLFLAGLILLLLAAPGTGEERREMYTWKTTVERGVSISFIMTILQVSEVIFLISDQPSELQIGNPGR